jgi:hypothetical protein
MRVWDRVAKSLVPKNVHLILAFSWIAIVPGTALAGLFDSTSPEILTRVQADEWGSVPGYIFFDHEKAEGFPVSVLVKEPFFGDEKSYETWITREDQLAGGQTWTIRVVVTHQNGKLREARYIVDLG